MLKNLKLILLLSVAMFIFLGIGNASASSKGHGDKVYKRPEITQVSSSNTHSADLKFKFKKDKGQKVSVKVRITNKKTGDSYTKKFKKVKIGCDGMAKLRVDCLRIGTHYSFKLNVKGPCDCDYSCKSESKCVQIDP
jgi:hypothetical protein